jgi:hypothetical protein
VDQQEFLESMEDRRGESVEQIYGLLSGTSEYANIHQILDDLNNVRGGSSSWR